MHTVNRKIQKDLYFLNKNQIKNRKKLQLTTSCVYAIIFLFESKHFERISKS